MARYIFNQTGSFNRLLVYKIIKQKKLDTKHVKEVSESKNLIFRNFSFENLASEIREVKPL